MRCMGSRTHLAGRVAGTAIKPELALHFSEEGRSNSVVFGKRTTDAESVPFT